MEAWGAALYGDPCRGCGFDWSLAPFSAIETIEGLPQRLSSVIQGATGEERGDGWSVAEYVSHVADNLRQWAERVNAARLDGQTRVAGYDPDELAAARGYRTIPLHAAQWSLTLSVSAWACTLRAGLNKAIVLQHATRGIQRAEDIARNNAHDGIHHVWDIGCILGGQP